MQQKVKVFQKEKYSPEKKFDFAFDFNLILKIFSRKRKNPRSLFTATFSTRLKSKRRKFDQLSPVHWLSAVHCRPGALAEGLVCHSVSAAELFFQNRKTKRILSFKYWIKLLTFFLAFKLLQSQSFKNTNRKNSFSST